MADKRKRPDGDARESRNANIPSRDAEGRMSERPDAAREMERTAHGIGGLSDIVEEHNGPRHGDGHGDGENEGGGAIGTMPAKSPTPRESRFEEGDLHEGDNTITGGGATVRTKQDAKKNP